MTKLFEMEALQLTLRLSAIEYFEIIDPWTEEGTKSRLLIHMRSGEQIVLGEPSIAADKEWDAEAMYERLTAAIEQEDNYVRSE